MASNEFGAATARESTHNRARRLRRGMTHPERLLWSVLRNRGLGGLKFRRQCPIGSYVVDFYCHERRLVVEVDGESHEGQEKKDARRQEFLQEFGYQVFRVTNDEVLSNLEGVALGIAKAAGVMV
ncbi:MAG: endonuclease domain-containing protein [Planctomycetes bacterium]|nr:endonuclease domain-containing protein [Planctomycetota bacterium]